ncbi:MAG: ATP-dependent 6-phosphofructokinase [Acidobacteria bacterium]|nr:ATP-dependent 6-phosphofructokinase [Acidobacteriota bacterium]
MHKTVGILTGGGDCPGLNAVIRAVVRRVRSLGYATTGIMEGWRGLLENKMERLDLERVSGIVYRGGTILRTSRTNPLKRPDGLSTIKTNLQKNAIDALVAIGGDDTMGVADRLFQDGVAVVGIPKTIDNDLSGTDYCFGFDTAVNIATEAIDRLHTTAEAHNRVMVVEVMGRDTGWIAVASGIAGGADMILIPEQPVDLDQLCAVLRKRHGRGKYFSIVVVAEGVQLPSAPEGSPGPVQQDAVVDEFGHARLGGVGQALARVVESRTGFETRVVTLGHLQRGGNPTAFDRILGTRFGVHAANLIDRQEFGKMVALRGTRIVAIPLAEATREPRRVDPELYATASVFFG